MPEWRASEFFCLSAMQTPVIEMRLDDETMWVTQTQFLELFQSPRANIGGRIRKIEGNLSW